MGIVSISDGIEARLATISGLHGSSEWQDTPNPPCAIPLVTRVQFDTFATRYTVIFRVLMLSGGISQMGMGKASRALKAYLEPVGTYSILAALDGDTTLGGEAEAIILDAAYWDQEREHLINGIAYWGAPLENIEVLFTAT